MSYVIYNKETTIIVSGRRSWERKDFATEAAAKAALTRMIKKSNGKMVRENYAIIENGLFFKMIEKTVVVTNLMSGKEVRQSVNTPRCCDVSSELYWTM
jgi:hypothetical protein